MQLVLKTDWIMEKYRTNKQDIKPIMNNRQMKIHLSLSKLVDNLQLLKNFFIRMD